MGDYSPSGHTPSYGGTCKSRPDGNVESKYLGTVFYKTDLNGYTARQFKSSINHIEEVTLPDDSKKIFVLTDRGLFYIDSQDALHRVSVPIQNLPINVTNIEDDKIIDNDGSRYYWNEETQTYEKSIVDNNGNKAAKLSYYTSKVLYNTITDERDNIVKCYVTSNGSYLSYLYEGYEGDRCWQVPMTNLKCTFVFKNFKNEIFGISDNNLYIFNKNNKTWAIKQCKYSVTEEVDGSEVTNLVDISNIKYISELENIDGIGSCIFLFCSDGKVYYTVRNTDDINNPYDYNNFIKLDSIIEYTNGEWTDVNNTIPNITYLNYDTDNIIFSGGSSVYMISKSISYQNDKLSIIKNTTFNESNCCNIMISDGIVYAVTYNVSVTNRQLPDSLPYYITKKNSKWWRFHTKKWSSSTAAQKKLIPEGWELYYFSDPKDSRSNSHDYQFAQKQRVYDISTASDYVYTYKLHKILIDGYLFSSQTTNISSRYSFTKVNTITKLVHDSDNNPQIVIVYHQKSASNTETTQINMVGGYNKYIVYTSTNEGISTFHKVYDTFVCLSYVNQNQPYETVYDGQTITWSDILYNGCAVSNVTTNSIYLLELLYNNKVIRQHKVKKQPYVNGFHSIKLNDNYIKLATPIGLYKLNLNGQLQEDSINIDITGNTNFREVYELRYDAGVYQGNWFVFTTSDGLINCRAGDPDDSSWQPEWHMFKYGISFWKIRFSSVPTKDVETGKEMVHFDNAFTVKYPSYIN